MRKIKVRPAEPRDTEEFLKFEAGNADKNDFDPQAGLYPSSFTFCAENDRGPVLFLPVQRPFLLESVGPNPASNKKDIALSLRKIVNELVRLARLAGIGEIMFLATDPSIERFAAKRGFEKLPHPVYRLRVKDYKCTPELS